VGGHGLPRLGGDFTRVARLAAKYHAGIRITNECPDYALNFAMTRWISTAARFYGAWLGTEPASIPIEPESIAQRVFNARSSGASELFCYQPAPSSKAAYLALAENLHYLKKDRPTVSVAYWIPRTHMMAVGEVDYLGQMMALRGVTDFDAVDSTLIADGALDRYQVLVMGHGYVEDAAVLEKIRRWVASGGALIRIEADPLTTLDGSTDYQAALFSAAPTAPPVTWKQARRLGEGCTILVPPAQANDGGYPAVVDRLLSTLQDLDGGRVAPPRVTGATGVYGSLMQSQYLILNAGSSPAGVTFDIPIAGGARRTGTVTIPAHAIRSIALNH
jgi:hypothetical protein